MHYFMKKETVLSCIQPTGEMHLGNYLGAIKNWKELQPNYKCFYGIVDYHAMTMPYQAAQLRSNVENMVIDLLACGIQPENLFLQSLVPEHTELGWILGCIAPFGELTRQTQFKDKSVHLDELKGQSISCGLFTYPVLQAADILIYHANKVPVGKDQEQHLELARNIADKFNSTFGCEYFAPPQCLFTEIPKVMSLADPTKKMSKSLGSKHYVALFDDADTIKNKVKGAVTASSDNQSGSSVGVENLLGLIKALGKNDLYNELLEQESNKTLKYIHLKEVLTDTLIAFTNELRNNRTILLDNKEKTLEQVRQSSSDIRKVARQTLNEVREIVGLPVQN